MQVCALRIFSALGARAGSWNRARLGTVSEPLPVAAPPPATVASGGMGSGSIFLTPIFVPLLLLAYRLSSPHVLPLVFPALHHARHASLANDRFFLVEEMTEMVDVSDYYFLRHQQNFSLATGGDSKIPNTLAAVLQRVVCPPP